MHTVKRTIAESTIFAKQSSSTKDGKTLARATEATSQAETASADSVSLASNTVNTDKPEQPYIETLAMGAVIHGDVSQDQLEKHLLRLDGTSESAAWQMGDVAAQIAKMSRRKLKEFAEKHGLNYGTLRTYGAVAKAIPLSTRVASLTFLHHRKVAKVKDAEAQKQWLQKACDEKLSAQALGRKIASENGTKAKASTSSASKIAKTLQKLKEQVADLNDEWGQEDRDLVYQAVDELHDLCQPQEPETIEEAA